MQQNLRDGTRDCTCFPESDSSQLDSEFFTDQQPIRKAVIIAAGNGSRLEGYQNGTPKPLLKVAGLALIKRVILSAKKAGVGLSRSGIWRREISPPFWKDITTWS